MYDKFLSKRIAMLRTAKKVSARDMSLSLGQNENYINHIENGKAMPSMQAFFYICEYFGITPREFFDEELKNPTAAHEVAKDLIGLEENQLSVLHEIIRLLKNSNDK